MKPAVPDWVVEGLPPLNARTVLSRGQKLTALLLALLLALAFAWRPYGTFLALNVGMIVLYLVFSYYKLFLQFRAMRSPPGAPPPAVAGDEALPRFSILVPLYREESALPGLVAHLGSLDYPPEKLQILLLVEEDDAGLRAVAERLRLAPPFEVLVVPACLPRTKPKACNYGLRQARGDLLVIYDAEDRPERDQLRKAAAAFAAAPDSVVCLQARLNFYNRDRNLLTRLFTAEYSAWFDQCLPGLYLLDAPIPLGGTSNHFRLGTLRQMRGWDAFNVTEDCDLGIRLYILGYRTGILDSTTWEEATFRVLPWIRQRSRWVKGYIQTWLVHMRQQRVMLRDMGAGRTAQFHLLFGATFFCLLVNPVYWLMTLLWFTARPAFISEFFPLWVMLAGLVSFIGANAAFVLASMLACLQRRYFHLVPTCLLIPGYWVLMSLGAWKGALQLIWKPFFWEKTPHEAQAALETAP